MGEGGPDNLCFTCGGTGDDGSGFCVVCLGSGKRVRAVNIFIKDVSDDIKDKLDTLQADMDIIKPQIQAIYDDLNP